MTSQYTHIVLSGGGMSGLVYLGALRYLQQEGYDQHIRHIAGSSIGALFGAAFALGVSMGDLEIRFKAFFQDPQNTAIHISMDSIISSIDNLGLDNGSRLVDPISDILGKMTFLELSKKTGKNLVISATHVQTMSPTYFSVDTTPHVIVADAVCASMAIPMLIRPIEIGDDLYIDGGVTDNLAMNAFINVVPETILILHLAASVVPNRNIGNKPSPMKYFTSMMETYMCNYLSRRLLESTYPSYCKFPICPVAFAPFVWEDDRFIIKISNEKIDESFAAGYRRIQEFLESIKPKDS